MTPYQKPVFYCGTSNILLPVPNKAFYPEQYQDKSRLHYYASLFNSLEVNSSFYKIPLPRTVAKWAEEVPEQFRFSFKLWQGITHVKGLKYDKTDLLRFFESVNRAGSRKGCILIQFPPNVTFSRFAPFGALLEDLKDCATEGWRIAIEFRDKSWYRDEVYTLLNAHKSGIVQHDMPNSATPLTDTGADFVYLRFHGEKGHYKGSYSPELLAGYAGSVHEWQHEGKEVFAYFNNTIGDALNNAVTLKRAVKEL